MVKIWPINTCQLSGLSYFLINLPNVRETVNSAHCRHNHYTGWSLKNYSFHFSIYSSIFPEVEILNKLHANLFSLTSSDAFQEPQWKFQ